MADWCTELTDKQKKFIAEQHIFYVATAPKDGRINLSPKGLTDTFKIVSDTCVAYLDFVGSGNETAAHILDDGRMTIMMTSFTRNPLILRIYGKGRFAQPGEPDFDSLIGDFPKLAGIRQIIFLDIESIQESCGYGVPVMTLDHERETMVKWAQSKGEDGVKDYARTKNVKSIDGLKTGLKTD